MLYAERLPILHLRLSMIEVYSHTTVVLPASDGSREAHKTVFFTEYDIPR